jgi:hypothetical protein
MAWSGAARVLVERAHPATAACGFVVRARGGAAGGGAARSSEAGGATGRHSEADAVPAGGGQASNSEEEIVEI